MRPYQQIQDGAAALAATNNAGGQYGALERANPRAEEVEGGLLAARGGTEAAARGGTEAAARGGTEAAARATSSGAVLAVVLALLGVLLTALTIAASYTSPLAGAGGRLQAPGPDAAAGTAREGGWEDMIPAQWRPKVNSSSSRSTSSGHGRKHPGVYDGPRNCTVDECADFKCNATMPIVCVAGFAAGGCAMVESAWTNPGCDDHCTLEFCPPSSDDDDDADADDADASEPKRLRATGPATKAPPREGGWEDMVPARWRPKTAANNNNASTHSSTPTSSSSSSHPSSHPGHAREAVRNCTLTECTTFHCNASFPFVCVDGFARGGCAGVASAWEHPGCDSYCSLKYCHSVVPKCGPCSDSDCHRLRAICGSHRHYACTAGPSNGGCSANATYWPEAEISGQCSACCDLRSCAAPLECAKSCTPFECEQVGECPASKSFACTKGPAARGCGTESFWEKAEFSNACEACCDTASCP